MRNRKIVKQLSLLIVLTVLIGLCFQFGIFNGKPDFSSLQMYGTLSQIYIGVYFLVERIWMNHHRKGVPAAFWKYSSFIAFTYGIIIGWIFVYPFYTDVKNNVQTAFVLLHVVLPAEVLLEWIIGEKGHFQKQFLIFGILPPVAYGITALILGALHKGIGMNGAAYPYPFMNVSQLGYGIVIPTCILYFVILLIWCGIMIETDTGIAAGKRKKRYDQTNRT